MRCLAVRCLAVRCLAVRCLAVRCLAVRCLAARSGAPLLDALVLATTDVASGAACWTHPKSIHGNLRPTSA